MSERLEETVTLSQAMELIQCLAAEESVLLLSPPGVGKSETVAQAAAAAGLPCRSLLGTQIAPEDVSGVPQIVGERSVFCPPRVLLPETNEPFCLFLDELPACTPDIQKAFYSLLLERRIGEHRLPPGSWVVAAGNRAQDRALVRTISSALVNRVIVLQIRVDVAEWHRWALQNLVRRDVIKFLDDYPEALMRAVPNEPVPFSTPRSWTLLSEALDELSSVNCATPTLDESVCRALAAGRVSAEDASRFAIWWAIRRNSGQDVAERGLRGLLNMGVFELGLSQSTANILQEAGLTIVQDLIVRRPKELRDRCRLIDGGRIDEIDERLATKGLRLGMDLRGVIIDR